MKAISKRSLVAGGAVAALLAVAGAAIAAGPPTSAPRLGQQTQAAHGYGYGYGSRAGGLVMDAAADYIGIDEAALATARHDGKSLAQIAVENGKTAVGLQKAVVAAFEVRIDAAIAAGNVTQAQADQLRVQLEARVQTMLERTATGPTFGVGGGSGAGLGLGPCGGVNR